MHYACIIGRQQARTVSIKRRFISSGELPAADVWMNSDGGGFLGFWRAAIIGSYLDIAGKNRHPGGVSQHFLALLGCASRYRPITSAGSP